MENLLVMRSKEARITRESQGCAFTTRQLQQRCFVNTFVALAKQE